MPTRVMSARPPAAGTLARLGFITTTLALLASNAGAQLSPAVPRLAVAPAPLPVPVPQVPIVSVGGRPFIEAWVDACNGDDFNGLVGCDRQPFKTINAAISAVAAMGPNATYPGLVHVNPGVYSNATNGEFLPVRMRNFVHVQGTGARQCVIRGGGPQNSSVFLPYNQAPCQCGTPNVPAEVLVDLSLSIGSQPYEEMLDGFTFQGGDVQVYVNDEEMNILGRVSNCVFDMLDHTRTEVGVGGPQFGVLIVHVFDPSGYKPDPLNILNNTFIQGWTPRDHGPDVLARPESVAICDVNDPLCYVSYPQVPDPSPRLRGIGPLNIQNNLIRSLPTAPFTSMLGIDSGDTTVSIGTNPGPSNAFDPLTVGGANSTYCSAIIGSPPRPRINTNPTSGSGPAGDPAFVGEMLTSSFGQPRTVSRDWRILPDSILVDQGSAPRNGVLTAVSGTSCRDTAGRYQPMSSFDFDGEVYGNLRIRGRQPDIGFDETSLLIDCAGWGNDSVSHRNACPEACAITNGQPVRGLIFPSAGTFLLVETRLPLPVVFTTPSTACPAPFYWSYTIMHGAQVPPTFQAGFPAPDNLAWLNPAFAVTGPAGSATAATYVAPFDPTVHTFGAGVAGANGPTQPCIYLNEQAIFLPTGSATNLLSNLQSSTD